MVSDKPALLDAVTEKALRWADEMLDLKVSRADEDFIKIQALKAEAARLIGQLKARVDGSSLRGGREDRIGAILERNLEKAQKALAAERPSANAQEG